VTRRIRYRDEWTIGRDSRYHETLTPRRLVVHVLAGLAVWALLIAFVWLALVMLGTVAS